MPVRLFYDFLMEEGVRESNPVGRGRYTPGRNRGGHGHARGLVPRLTKLPWIPTEQQWLDILAVAAEMVKGEIAYRKGEFDAAFAHLRKSVELDDNLPYDEPWGWMQPTRHALGALLLEQGQEAKSVYRADLGLDGTLSRCCQHPENVWSLHGLHECLVRLGKHAEAGIIKGKLNVASAWADVPIKSSCFCRLHHAA